jgi:hypothetical protein
MPIKILKQSRNFTDKGYYSKLSKLLSKTSEKNKLNSYRFRRVYCSLREYLIDFQAKKLIEGPTARRIYWDPVVFITRNHDCLVREWCYSWVLFLSRWRSREFSCLVSFDKKVFLLTSVSILCQSIYAPDYFVVSWLYILERNLENSAVSSYLFWLTLNYDLLTFPDVYRPACIYFSGMTGLKIPDILFLSHS